MKLARSCFVSFFLCTVALAGMSAPARAQAQIPVATRMSKASRQLPRKIHIFPRFPTKTSRSERGASGADGDAAAA